MDPLLEQFNLSLYRSNVAIYNGEGQDITQYLAGYYINTPQGVVTGLADLGSGDYAGEMTVSGGAMRSSNFKSGTAGWQLKYDGTLNASSVTLTGSITATAGTIGGFTIGATTITGSTLVLDSAGTIKTASSGQRVEINTQTLILYDTGAEVIKFGTASATDGNTTAVKLSLNANTLAGIQIDSATTATLGMRMDSSSNVVFNGLRIALTNTGTSNSGYGIYVAQSGSGGYGIDILKETAGTGMRIINNGTGVAAEINSSGNSASYGLRVKGNNASHSASLVYIDSVEAGLGLDIETSGTAGGVKIWHTPPSNSASLFIDHDFSYKAVQVDVDGADAGETVGIEIDARNSSSGVVIGLDLNTGGAGSGAYYAMRVSGVGKFVESSAVGGTQDRKIRVNIGGTLYYIPCYTA